MNLTNLYQGSVSLGVTWTPESGAFLYKIYYDISPNITTNSILAGEVSEFTSFIKIDLPPSTNFYFRVFSYDSDGIVINQSNELNINTISFNPSVKDDPPISIISHLSIPHNTFLEKCA